jgi:hypothetical protein
LAGRVVEGKMGKPTGFMEIQRHDRGYEKVEVRKKTWKIGRASCRERVLAMV